MTIVDNNIRSEIMKNLFEEIIENCNHKKVESLCKSLSKKFSALMYRSILSRIARRLQEAIYNKF